MNNSAQGRRALVKLSGSITNYKCIRTETSFVFTDADRTALGVVAITAAIAGLSGQAVSTAASAASTEEADFLEFELDGTPVKCWLWRSPFREGDVVDVAAEWQLDHYEAAGVARPADRIVALYPHCSRGRASHIRNALRWWFLGVSTFVLFCVLLLLVAAGGPQHFGSEDAEYTLYVALGCYFFFGLMTFSLARKWMPFVHLAEKVFTTFDFPHSSKVDLVKSSKAQRRPDDPGEYGTFYLRY